MLLSVGAAAWPSKTPCDRPLDVGVSFMQKPSIASDAIDATFVGKQCGDSSLPAWSCKSGACCDGHTETAYAGGVICK